MHYSDPKPKINEDWLCSKVRGTGGWGRTWGRQAGFWGQEVGAEWDYGDWGGGMVCSEGRGSERGREKCLGEAGGRRWVESRGGWEARSLGAGLGHWRRRKGAWSWLRDGGGLS